MLIRHADPTKTTPVDMEGVQGVSMEVMVGRADDAPNFALRHFVVDPGGHTPRHQHDYEHEVYVVEGQGEAECSGETCQVRAGDVLYIPPNEIHQFRNSNEAPMRFLCLVPVTFDCGTPTPGS